MSIEPLVLDPNPTKMCYTKTNGCRGRWTTGVGKLYALAGWVGASFDSLQNMFVS